jgi:ferredoxin--NADP+ reductase
MLPRILRARAGCLSFCIVGAGPAGLYSARQLYRELDPPPRILVLDRYPTPFGLLRHGVAPDHASIKQASNTLRRVLEEGTAQFCGHTTVGQHVSYQQLKSAFSAVLFCQGAGRQRPLGLPGEHSSPHVLTARDIVGWYNS